MSVVEIFKTDYFISSRFELQNISYKTAIKLNNVDISTPKQIKYRFFYTMVSEDILKFFKIIKFDGHDLNQDDQQLKFLLQDYKNDLEMLLMIEDDDIHFSAEVYPVISQKIEKCQLVKLLKNEISCLEARVI